ncbi:MULTISPECIES: alpha/beta fold hydrolase [Streptomyces]|uniref:Alpha/beta fold hydrolase n=1 Tax=Streptomyces luteosporeus TaxID=173856 RepID=A0ABN3TNC8_9ACTN
MSFRSEPAACPLRLVCFPHAGGSAGSVFPLSAAAPPELDVVAVQYPGRQWRRSEAAVGDLHGLARGAAEAVAALPPAPTAFLGHSMGALVAFETARLLESRHPGGVLHLFASGSRAPAHPRAEARRGTWSDEQIAAEVRRLGGTDAGMLPDDEALRMNLPALRDDYRALAAYACAPGAATGVPLTALVGREDPTTGPDDAARWRAHTTAAFGGVHVFPGGHFYLAAQADAVVRLVIERLAAVPRP